MLERLRNFTLALGDERVRDTAKVASANFGTMAFAHLLELRVWAELGLIALTAAYTIWKWRREAKGEKDK